LAPLQRCVWPTSVEAAHAQAVPAPPLGSTITKQVWLTNMEAVDGSGEVKAVLVATGKCLAELPPLQVRVETRVTRGLTPWKRRRKRKDYGQ